MAGLIGVTALRQELFDFYLYLFYVAEPLERRQKEFELCAPAKANAEAARSEVRRKQQLPVARRRSGGGGGGTTHGSRWVTASRRRSKREWAGTGR